MARFILEYDISIGIKTKAFIIDKLIPSMTSPNMDSAQYGLSETIHLLVYNRDCFDSNTYKEDIDYLEELKKDGVTYVEICW